MKFLSKKISLSYASKKVVACRVDSKLAPPRKRQEKGVFKVALSGVERGCFGVPKCRFRV